MGILTRSGSILIQTHGAIVAPLKKAGRMKTITASKYLALDPELRGIWTTERTDIAGWELVRDQYIGKRTMTTGGVDDLEIFVEGINLRIVEDVPDSYRGWSISDTPIGYSACSPDYDASYEGPEDGWVTSGGSASGSTIKELKEAIDEYILENEDDGDTNSTKEL